MVLVGERDPRNQWGGVMQLNRHGVELCKLLQEEKRAMSPIDLSNRIQVGLADSSVIPLSRFVFQASSSRDGREADSAFAKIKLLVTVC